MNTTDSAAKSPLDAPANLAGLVQYQDGSVVSREVLRQPGGRVTIFAFDAGQGLSEHTSPYEALVQVVEGAVTIRIAGTPHRVTAGQILRLPAKVPHALQAEGRFKMLLTMART